MKPKEIIADEEAKQTIAVAKENLSRKEADASMESASSKGNRTTTVSKNLINNAEVDVETTLLSRQEKQAVEKHERLSPHLMFEIIRRDGLEEMQRPVKALIYSGIVAGILVSLSFICYAVLLAVLPKTEWSNVIAKWGYSVGFIIVILGRMQLFTENTITTVVPIFKPFQWIKVWVTFKLWMIVFLSNLIGTTIAATYLSIPGAMNPEFTQELLHISHHVTSMSIWENFIRGIPAGILIASIVWMMPNARGFSIFLIGILTYFISLGDFTHVVVGSTEMAYAIMHGQANIMQYFFQFLIPTGLGNIIGGTAIFTVLVYGQIKEELPLKKFHSSHSTQSMSKYE